MSNISLTDLKPAEGSTSKSKRVGRGRSSGHGKTSVINKLYEDLNKKENICVVKIDRFETIPIKDNEKNFLFFMSSHSFQLSNCNGVYFLNSNMISLLF